MNDDDYPRAVVREINGQLVLDDPDALAVIQAVEKHNCKITLEAHADRVVHFKQRLVDRGLMPDDYCIVILSMDDRNGKRLGDILMPGQEAMWQSMRDQGQIPFARGLASRPALQELVEALDKETGDRLRDMKGKTVVVVMDRGVAEVFEA